MLIKRVTSLLLCVTTVLIGGSRAQGGVITLSYTSDADVAHQLTSGILKANVGTNSVRQWVSGISRTANAEKLIATADWQSVRRDVTTVFGNTPGVKQYLAGQESLIKVHSKVNNVAHSQSLNVKGNLVEEMMDNFYKKDGWEVINGKRGRNGFDGLYVKRRPNGEIYDFIIADAKSGNAKLGMTKHGKQLSPEWCRHNFNELLKRELHKQPRNFAFIADLKQLIKLHETGAGRVPRVFSMKIEQRDGKTYYSRINTDINGKVIGRPYAVDMSKKSKNQQAICRRFKEHLAQYNIGNADKISRKIERAFTNGEITTDSDLYRLVKREIPDQKMAAAVAHSMGEKLPTRRQLTLIGKQWCGRLGLRNNSLYAAGQLIAQLMQGRMQKGLILQSVKQLSFDSGRELILGMATNEGVHYSTNYFAKRQLRSMGKKATEKAVAARASKLLPTVGKIAGAGIGTAFSAYSVWDNYKEYSAGNMSQRDLAVYSTLDVGAGAGAVIAAWAAAGSAGGPLGIAAGLGVAVLTQGGKLLYDYYTAKEKRAQELARREAMEVVNKNELERRREKRLSTLKNSAKQKWEDGWKQLRPIKTPPLK